MKIFSFYKIERIKNLKSLKIKIIKEIQKNNIKGLVILSKEGINATIAGNSKDISNIVKYIKLILNIKKFDIENITYSSFIPFFKAKVKIKNEVVPMDYNFSFKNKNS